MSETASADPVLPFFDLGLSADDFGGEFTVPDERAAISPSESVKNNVLRIMGDVPVTISWSQSRRTTMR
jgi:hypothetical protein